MIIVDCRSVSTPYTKGDIEDSEKVQKRAIGLYRLLPELKGFKYCDRLTASKLPTLHYWRLYDEIWSRRLKQCQGNNDKCTAPILTGLHSSVTRGHDIRLEKFRAKYYLRKFFCTNRVVNNWNSLPSHVVHADTVNSFKIRLDNFWKSQDVWYD